jgi:uncharacterized membrane-anchored protein YhcB (DUF1043 family)
MEFFSVISSIGVIIAIPILIYLFIRAKKDMDSDVINRTEDFEKIKKELDSKSRTIDSKYELMKSLDDRFFKKYQECLQLIDMKMAVMKLDREDRRIYKDRFHDLVIRINENENNNVDIQKEVVRLHSIIAINESRISSLENKLASKKDNI